MKITITRKFLQILLFIIKIFIILIVLVYLVLLIIMVQVSDEDSLDNDFPIDFNDISGIIKELWAWLMNFTTEDRGKGLRDKFRPLMPRPMGMPIESGFSDELEHTVSTPRDTYGDEDHRSFLLSLCQSRDQEVEDIASLLRKTGISISKGQEYRDPDHTYEIIRHKDTIFYIKKDMFYLNVIQEDLELLKNKIMSYHNNHDTYIEYSNRSRKTYEQYTLVRSYNIERKFNDLISRSPYIGNELVVNPLSSTGTQNNPVIIPDTSPSNSPTIPDISSNDPPIINSNDNNNNNTNVTDISNNSPIVDLPNSTSNKMSINNLLTKTKRIWIDSMVNHTCKIWINSLINNNNNNNNETPVNNRLKDNSNKNKIPVESLLNDNSNKNKIPVNSLLNNNKETSVNSSLNPTSNEMPANSPLNDNSRGEDKMNISSILNDDDRD